VYADDLAAMTTAVTKVYVLCSVLAAVAGGVRADVLIEAPDWDPGPRDWAAGLRWEGADAVSAGARTGNWWRVAFEAADGPVRAPAGRAASMYGPATNHFAGPPGTGTWVSVDFWASDRDPETSPSEYLAALSAREWFGTAQTNMPLRVARPAKGAAPRTAIPEPASGTLLGVALIVTALACRRNRDGQS
jgi:hypothetical protein